VSDDLQREHPLVKRAGFKSLEGYFLHLIHRRAYDEACTYVAGKRVLDWGCNDGFGVEYMRDRAAEIAGLDVAPQAVEAARKRFGPGGPRIELYDGKRSPYTDSSFDVITSFQLIEHLTSHDEFFDELVRVLADDGVALFTTPNGRMRLNPGLPPWNRFHVREFAPSELRGLLRRWFRQVEIVGMTGAPEIMSVELRRIEQAKADQRARLRAEAPPERRWQRVARDVAHAVHALRVTGALRPRIPTEIAKAPPSPDHLARFSVADLAYSSRRLDTKLDLFAICRGPIKRAAASGAGRTR